MGLIVVSLAVVAYALVGKRLASTPFSGPMLFMVLGVALGPAGVDAIHGADDRATIALLLEVALALVLFTDSLEISSGDWRAKSRLPTRLLVIGMPLTMISGGGSPWRCSPGSTSGRRRCSRSVWRLRMRRSVRPSCRAPGCRSRSGRR